MKFFKYTLFPFSLCYWIFTWCRNFCFDNGILKQTKFAIPIISVGNITVGGTGKTPHVQYLVKILDNKNVASLSRGYKRKSKGFLLANENTSVEELGDEPFQLHKRFPNLSVAVCEKRVVGVQNLLKLNSNLQTIILDDAFQHRYIKPSFQIVLIDYNRPIWNDFVFPVGFLREGKYAIKRADVVIITKCPNDISEKEAEFWKNKLKLATTQKLFFSTMQYGQIYDNITKQNIDNQKFITENNICLVTGIAQPQPLIHYLMQYNNTISTEIFPDHYSYTEKDAVRLQKINKNKLLLTTEKDAYKLSKMLPDVKLFVIPIMPQFLFDKNEEFNKLIRNIVDKN